MVLPKVKPLLSGRNLQEELRISFAVKLFAACVEKSDSFLHICELATDTDRNKGVFDRVKAGREWLYKVSVQVQQISV